MPKDRGTLGFILETMIDAESSELAKTFYGLSREIKNAYRDAAKSLSQEESALALYAVQVLSDVQSARSTNEARAGVGAKKKERSA